MRLRTTVHTFWMHDWNSSGLRTGQRFGPRYALNVISLHCRMPHAEAATQQKQSRVHKIATLACAGEKGRALAAARNAPPVPVTEQNVQEIKSLYSTDPEPPAPAQAFVSGLVMSEVAEHIPNTLRKMSRLSEPGPLGMRAENWYDFGFSGREQQLVCASSCTHSISSSSPLSSTISQGWKDHAARQTHRCPQTLLMMSFLSNQ